jgi:hypothetical protein
MMTKKLMFIVVGSRPVPGNVESDFAKLFHAFSVGCW